jgi:hypothetical protein
MTPNPQKLAKISSNRFTSRAREDLNQKEGRHKERKQGKGRGNLDDVSTMVSGTRSG